MTAAAGKTLDGQTELLVTCDGTAVSREFQLLAASITHLANRISRATLIYQDGDAATGEFELCSSGTLAPGKAIRIAVVAGGQSVPLFEGLTVRQSVRIRTQGGAQLTIECRHHSVRLTHGTRVAVDTDVTDDDILGRLLKKQGVSCELRGLSQRHEQLVQPGVSDWKFLVARSRANGCNVLTRVGPIRIERPERREPAAIFRFGDGVLLELDASQDARWQIKKLQSSRWDSGEQAEVSVGGGGVLPQFAGALPAQAIEAVNGTQELVLSNAVATESEARQRAESAKLHGVLSQVCGRLRCSRIVTNVLPGDTIRLQNVSQPFSGDVYVTGVRHELDSGRALRTSLQVGTAEEDRGSEAVAAEHLLPPLQGLHPAIVTETVDPAGEYRVRVRLVLSTGIAGAAPAKTELWARLATIDAGPGRGLMTRPEPGDEVVVGFNSGAGHCPVIVGMLHSSAHDPPVAPAEGNHIKLLKSRSGLMVQLNDDKKELSLGTAGGLQLKFSDQEKKISLTDGSGNTVTLGTDGIQIQSSKALTMEGKMSAGLKGGQSASVEGLQVQVSASGTASIRGSLVSIN